MFVVQKSRTGGTKCGTYSLWFFLPVPWHWPHRCSAAHPAAPSSARPAWGQGLCSSHPSINQIQLSNQLPYVDPHYRIPEPGGEKMAKNFYQKSLKLEYFILYFIHFKIYFFKINAVSLKTYKKYWYFPYQLSFKLFFSKLVFSPRIHGSASGWRLMRTQDPDYNAGGSSPVCLAKVKNMTSWTLQNC